MASYEHTRKNRKAILTRLTDKRYEEIRSTAKRKGLSSQEYLIACHDTCQGNITEVPKEEIQNLVSQIIRIGNNINTALRKINMGEYHMIGDMKDTIEQSAAEIRIIKKKVSKIL